MKVKASNEIRPQGSERLLGRIKIELRLIRYGGPELTIEKESRTVDLFQVSGTSATIQNLMQQQSGKTSAADHKKTYFTEIEGNVAKAERVLFHGKEVTLKKGIFRTPVALKPGNNSFLVFLYDKNKNVSNYEVDVQLIDFSYDGIKPSRDEIVVVQQTTRPEGIVVSAGLTYGPLKFQTEGSPKTVNVEGGFGVEGMFTYWFDKTKPVWRDLSVEIGAHYHLQPLDTGTFKPSLMLIKWGPRYRLYFLDQDVSPMIHGGIASLIYSVDDTVHEPGIADNIFASAGAELPLLRLVKIFGQVEYGFTFSTDSSVRTVELLAGSSIRIFESLYLKVYGFTRNYSHILAPSGDVIHHSFSGLCVGVDWDI